MSFTNFMISGPEFANRSHSRQSSEFPRDSSEAVSSTYRYRGVVTADIQENNRSERWIDEAVKVQSVSDVVRDNEQSVWKRLKYQALALGSFSVVLATGSGFLAMSTNEGSSSELVALISTTASMVFGAAGSFFRASQASRNQEEWVDPIIALKEQRVLCHPKNGGLAYVKEHRLMGKVVSEDETRNIWHGSVEVLKTNFEDTKRYDRSIKAKAHFIHKFFHNNPFDLTRLNYAFAYGDIYDPADGGGQVWQREKIDSITRVFTRSKESYQILNEEHEQSAQLLQLKTENEIFENKRLEDLMKAPFIAAFEFHKTEAESERDRKLKPDCENLQERIRTIKRCYPEGAVQKRMIEEAEKAYHDLPVVKAAFETFSAKMNNYETCLKLALDPIELYFTRRVNRIKNELGRALNVSHEKHEKNLLRFYPTINLIFEAYVKRGRGVNMEPDISFHPASADPSGSDLEFEEIIDIVHPYTFDRMYHPSNAPSEWETFYLVARKRFA